MYKAFMATFILFGTFAFASSHRKKDIESPHIVAQGAFVNQTAPISRMTLFTPHKATAFRMSVYITITTTDPTSNSSWNPILYWTDDAGQQQVQLLSAGGTKLGPAYSFAFMPGNVAIIEGTVDVPVTFALTQTPAPDKSVYSLYYVLEVLEPIR